MTAAEAVLFVWAVGSFALVGLLLIRSGQLANPRAWAAALIGATAFLLVSVLFGRYDWHKIAFVFGGLATGVLVATAGHPVEFLDPGLLRPMEDYLRIQHERRQRTVALRFIWLIAAALIGLIVGAVVLVK
jgi:hypothetical protein